jgi:hypothetical protein
VFLEVLCWSKDCVFKFLSRIKCTSRNWSVNIKCVLIFCTNFVWNISHSKKNAMRYDQKYILFSRNYPLLLSDFNFSGQILEKSLDIKFHEHSYSGRPFFPWGQTDWHDEANSLFWQFFFLRKCLKTKQFGVYRDVKVRFRARVRSYKLFKLFILRQMQYLKRIYSTVIEHIFKWRI